MYYFPNNYEEVLNSEYSEVDAKEVLNFSESWSLPGEFAYVIRVYWDDRIVERSFRSKASADKYIQQIQKEQLEYIVYDNEQLEHNELVECD